MITLLLVAFPVAFAVAVALLCWVLPSEGADLAAIRGVRVRRDEREGVTP